MQSPPFARAIEHRRQRRRYVAEESVALGVHVKMAAREDANPKRAVCLISPALQGGFVAPAGSCAPPNAEIGHGKAARLLGWNVSSAAISARSTGISNASISGESSSSPGTPP